MNNPLERPRPKFRLNRLICVMSLVSCLGLSTAQAEQSISFAEAMSKTLSNNVQLQSYPYELRMTEAEKIQASIKPNPIVRAELADILGTGDVSGIKSAELTLALSQTIEMGNKLERRIAVVDAKSAQQQAAYELKRLDVLAETSRRYYQVLRLQDLQSMTQRRIVQEQAALKIIKKRAQAGAVGQADVAKMALRLAYSESLQARLTDEFTLSKMRLAAMWMQQAEFDVVEGDLAVSPQWPDKAQLEQAIEQAPWWLQQRAKQRLAESRWQLAQANGVSNIDLGVGFRRFEATNEQALLFNFSMPLTRENPNRGEIARAGIERELVDVESQLRKAEIGLELAEIQQNMRSNNNQITTIKMQLLPHAETLLKETKDGYQYGRYTVLQWVDAQTEVFDLARELVELQTHVYLQLLELERLTGQSLTQTPAA